MDTTTVTNFYQSVLYFIINRNDKQKQLNITKNWTKNKQAMTNEQTNERENADNNELKGTTYKQNQK